MPYIELKEVTMKPVYNAGITRVLALKPGTVTILAGDFPIGEELDEDGEVVDIYGQKLIGVHHNATKAKVIHTLAKFIGFRAARKMWKNENAVAHALGLGHPCYRGFVF